MRYEPARIKVIRNRIFTAGRWNGYKFKRPNRFIPAGYRGFIPVTIESIAALNNIRAEYDLYNRIE